MNEQHRINVSVKTAYIDEQSDPENHRFVFSYTIRIKNEGTTSARLVSRHWHITDANGQVQEVRGLGVVGEQPYLKPGEDFEYTSGTVIETPVGSMQGSYQMVDDQKSEFDAPIPVFTLATPTALH
jgi:ApaG protein